MVANVVGRSLLMFTLENHVGGKDLCSWWPALIEAERQNVDRSG